MKAKHLCPVPKGLFPSGKMTKLPLNWPCSLRATVKGLALLKRQRRLDLLDSATTKSLISLWNEALRDLSALKKNLHLYRPANASLKVETHRTKVCVRF